jgi:hypothetical protein
MLGLLGATTGCDSSDSAPEIGGRYLGSAVTGGITVAYQMEIPPSTGGAFTWSGSFQFGTAGPEPIGGPGSYAYPSLTLTDDGESLTGTVSADGDELTFVDPESGARLVMRR